MYDAFLIARQIRPTAVHWYCRELLRKKLISTFTLTALFFFNHQIVYGISPSAIDPANMTYHGIANGPALLTEGLYEDTPYQPGGSSRLRIGLVDSLQLTGDLDEDGREDTAVFLWKSMGGSGTELFCAVLQDGMNGFTNTVTLPLGDRVQVVDGRIESGILLIDLIQHGPDDPRCCPSRIVRRKFTIKEGQLFDQSLQDRGRLTPDILEHHHWRLVKINGAEISPHQTAITLSYRNGVLTGTSGCHDFSVKIGSGEYPGSLIADPVITTRRHCGETIDASEKKFLDALTHLNHYGFLGGQLALGWRKNNEVGTLVFRKSPSSSTTRK